MTLVADSGALYALYDADDAHHAGVREVIDREQGATVLPMVLLGELDHLLREFLGVDAEWDFLEAIATGGYTVEPLVPSDLERCRELVKGYRDLDLGLVDAAVIATAERLGVQDILTVDERDFQAVHPRRGPYTLLPADAPAGD